MTLLLAFYPLACLGMGVVWLRLTKYTDALPTSARLALSFILGVGGLGWLWSILISLGWFTPVVVGGVSVLFGVMGVLEVWGLRHALVQAVGYIGHELRAESWLGRVLMVAVLSLIGLTALRVILPVTWDAGATYLLMPSYVALSGDWSLMPNWTHFEVSGFIAEAHMAVHLLAEHLLLGRLFMWWVAVAIGVLLADIGQHRLQLPPSARWMIWAILFTSTAFTNLIADGKTDLVGMALALLAWWFLLQLDPASLTPRALMFVGAMVGMATLSKLTYLALLGFSFSLYVGWLLVTTRHSLKHGLREAIGALVWIGVGGVVVLIPHFIRNGLFFGEPFTPFIRLHPTDRASVIGEAWTPPAVVNHVRWLYPFFTVLGRDRLNYMYGNLSPLWLACLPSGLWVMWHQRSNRRLWAVMLIVTLTMVLYLALLYTVLELRYVLGMVAFWMVLASLGAVGIPSRGYQAGVQSLTLAVVLGAIVVIGREVRQSLPLIVPRHLMTCTTDPYCLAMKAVEDDGAQLNEPIWIETRYRYPLRLDLLQHRVGGLAIDPWTNPQQAWCRVLEDQARYIITVIPNRDLYPTQFDPSTLPLGMTLHNLADHAGMNVWRLDLTDASLAQDACSISP
ncbi:MAG: hypothetical protein ACOYLB_09545 [Phototrophicaceae bacterium]